MKKTVIHAAAGTTAMLLVATFWTSALISELFLDHAAVAAVKHAVAYYGLALLVVAMAATGGSGFSLAQGRKGRLVEEKKKRMPLLGLNGALIMIPSALFLNARAAAGQFDEVFYAVQALELAVGVLQLTLLFKSFRAGLKLSGRLRPAPTKA